MPTEEKDPNETVGAEGDFSTRGPASGSTAATELRPIEQRFHVLHLHAQGGLGQVWMAEDADLQRKVALKEIRNEHADQPDSRARFVQEAEITGRLEHPGIVPVYALGQHGDGRPYYVMRFIRGHSLQDAIKRYHEVRQGKSTDGDAPTLRQVLARFVDVCEAVAYAHSRGVLHRDLKPENVMLGLYGETLVVDWGLAKADSEPAPTQTSAGEPESVVKISSGTPTRLGSALGTPGYMSPEQARGGADMLSTATDIYSLGATLFYILAGRAPVADKDVAQVLEDTREGKFPTPRMLVASIPRPLESICLRALALDPAQRYGTALELAADVGHYLDDEPVVAHCDSLIERTGRWIRRHKSGVVAGAAGLALVAVVASVSAVMIAHSRDVALQLAEDNAQLAEAERQSRETAQRRQEEAEQAKLRAQEQQARAEKYYELAINTVDRFLTNVADDDRLKAVGLENLRRDLLVQARDFYDLVIEQAEADADPLHAERANAHQRLADISFEVGEYDDAIEAYQRAAEHLLALGQENADPAEYAILANDLALTFDTAGKREEAVKLWRGLVDPIEQLIQSEPENANYRDLLATVQLNLALDLTSRSPAESIALSATAKQHVQEALKQAPGDFDYRNTLALIHNNLGNTLIDRERFEEAAGELKIAETIWQELKTETDGWLADDLDDHLALVQLNRAAVEAAVGDNDQAAHHLQQGLAIRSRLARQHPDSVHLQTGLADMHYNAAIHYRTMVQYAESLGQTSAALEILQRLDAAHPDVPTYRGDLAATLLEHGTTQLSMGSMEEAIESMQRAIELSTSLVDLDPNQTGYRRTRALSRYYLGLVLIDAAQMSSAAEVMEQAAEEMQELQNPSEDLELMATLADCQTTLGALFGPEMLAEATKEQQWWRRGRRHGRRFAQRARRVAATAVTSIASAHQPRWSAYRT